MAPGGYAPAPPATGVPQPPHPQQYPQGYPQQPYPQQPYPQQPYPQQPYPPPPYPQQYPQGYPQQPYPQQYPQGYPPGYAPPGYAPPGYYPGAPPVYYGPPGSYETPGKKGRYVDVDVKAVVSGSVLLGVAWSLGSIIAVVVIEGNNGNGKGTEPLFIPVIGPFIAAGTTGAFDQKNNSTELGFLLIADGLAQIGGLTSVLVGSIAGKSGSNWAKNNPALPEVKVGLGTTQLKWQF